MNISFGLNIAKRNVKNVRKHNARKRYFKDKNKNINWNLTKYNRHYVLLNYDKLMTQHCQNYVKNYNKRQRQQGHKKRCISIKNYYKKHGSNASRNIVISIGNESDRNQLEDNILDHYQVPKEKRKEDKLLLRTRIEPKALKQEALDINKRSKYLKLTDVYIHVDEGILHEHAKMVALPSPTHTKYQRPSFSFSKAVREEGHNKDGRQALSNIIHREAPHAINTLSHVMFNYPLRYKATGNATKLSGNQYKHYAKASDKAKNEQFKANSATSIARSASTAKSTAVKDYKSIMTNFFTSGYNDGSKAGSIANSKSADSRVINANSSASTSASNATNLAYSSISTSWASRSADLDIREHHINTTATATNNLKNNLTKSFRDEVNTNKIKKMTFHNIFKTLIYWSKNFQKIAKKVKRAKKKAHLIIIHARTTAKNFLRPNKFGEHVLQNFIWNHKNCYPNVFHKNPYHLHGKQLMYELNETSYNYHEFDSPEAQREIQQIKARSKNPGKIWGE